MTVEFSTEDHRKIDTALDGVLDAYHQGRVTREQAREALAHVITAAAQGNEAEVRDWIEPDRLDRWKKLCSQT